MALQDNNLMLLDLADGFPRTIDNANDTLGIGVDTSFAADLAVGGNLTVTGDIISGGTMDVVVSDNFIDLSNGQGTGANKAGGLTVNVKAAAARQSMSIAGGAPNDVVFSGGNTIDFGAAAFDPAAAGLADGDIIEIAGAADFAGNNGLFVVDSVTNQTIVIKGVSQTQAPWAQTAFENGTETAVGATLAPSVDLGVFCISDGALLDAGGNPIPVGQFVSAFDTAAKLSTLQYEAAANVSLQEAYNVGQLINLNDAQGDMVIRTDDTAPRADFQLTNEGATADFLKTSAGLLTIGSGSTNKTAMAGEVSTDITFDGVGGRRIVQTGQDVRLETLTAGDIDLQAANSIDMVASGGVPGSRFSLSGQNLQADCPIFASFNDAADKSIVLGAANTGAGNADILIGDSTNVRNTALQANAELSLSSAGLLSMTSNSALAATAGAAAALLRANSGGATVYGSTNTLIMADANGLELRANGLGVDIVAGGADINLTATSNQIVGVAQAGIDLTATTGGFSIDSAAGNSNVTANAANLTLATTASGDVNVTSAAAIVGVAATNASLTATSGSATLEAPAGAATVTGSGLVTLASSAGNLDIDAATGIAMDAANGDVTIQAAAGNANLVAVLGDVGVIAQAAGATAVMTSTAGNATVQGLSANLRATGGALGIDMQHAGSKLTLSSSGNAATDAIDIHASGGGAKLRSAGDLAISSSANNVTIDATSVGSGIVLTAEANAEMRASGAGGSVALLATQGPVILATGVGIAVGGAIVADGHFTFANNAAGAGYTGIATAAIAVGQVCSIPLAGALDDVEVAARTSANIPVGMCLVAAAAVNDPVSMHTVHGVPVQTATAAVNADVGKLMYLDAAGAMTFTAPVASGDYVWRLGTCTGVSGGNAVMVWAPQFVAKRP